MKISSLRAIGFCFVKLGGPITQIKHDYPFSVDGKPARMVYDGTGSYEFNARGWFDKECPRTLKLI